MPFRAQIAVEMPLEVHCEVLNEIEAKSYICKAVLRAAQHTNQS